MVSTAFLLNAQRVYVLMRRVCSDAQNAEDKNRIIRVVTNSFLFNRLILSLISCLMIQKLNSRRMTMTGIICQ